MDFLETFGICDSNKAEINYSRDFFFETFNLRQDLINVIKRAEGESLSPWRTEPVVKDKISSFKIEFAHIP